MDIVMITMFMCMYLFFIYFLFEDMFTQEQFQPRQQYIPVKYIYIRQNPRQTSNAVPESSIPVSTNVCDSK